jgi:threonine dehydrogenase-like Zn-dependent dehydrogenase
MRALWLDGQSLSLREDLPHPTPSNDEALVRVELAGICATDLELCRGYFNFKGIIGHEFVGRIVEAKAAPHRIGERVVGEINAACSTCALCQRGLASHCPNRTVLGILGRNGAFAEMLTLPLQNLHPVPEQVSNDVAVFCEPLAAALEIQEQLKLSKEQRVLLIGAGRLGQLIAQTLQVLGVDLSVLVRREKQEHLLKKRGIKTIVQVELPQSGVDVVVEASGHPAGLALARRAVRPGGTIVLKSTYAEKAELDFSLLVVDEITLIGSRCGPFPEALQALAAGKVDPVPLIEGRYGLEDGLQAMTQAAEPGALKVLLQP